MNIVIAGAGKVGFDLAKTFSIGHDVTIIDNNQDALDKLSESLDILCIHGNLEDISSYATCKGRKIDLLIVVTDNDNVNLIATLLAGTFLEIDKIFVRFQNPSFTNQKLQEKLHIDKVIFPKKVASSSIAALLNYPKANNVKFFKYTDYRLASVAVSSSIVSQKIAENKYNIVGIEREKNFFIPDYEDSIMPNDLIYFFALDTDIHTICDLFYYEEKSKIEKCVVFGGDDLGISIAKALLDINKEVKLVEKDFNICEQANEILEGKVSIINSKYGTIELFENEGLDAADIFISATKNDEYNIIKCLEAKDRGIEKVVAINNEVEYYNFMHSLGIVAMRGPKMSAYNTIMEEVNSTGIILEKYFCGAKAVVYMRKIFVTSEHISKRVKHLTIKGVSLFYLRDNSFIKFSEPLVLEKNDILMVFCSVDVAPRAKRWIYEL